MRVESGGVVRSVGIVGALMAIGFAPWMGTTPQLKPGAGTLPMYSYSVVKTFPHDREAFTQGLEYVDGYLYEGTGLNGRSSIRKVKLETGEVLQKRDLSSEYFGEGVTVWRSELFQLTWQSGLALVYDRGTFAPRRMFNYTGEGWGLTHDVNGLVMSDGTDTLRFLDPATFRERRRLRVTALGVPVRELNELEWVNDEVLANVWQTDYIARIDPGSGQVRGWVDLRGLLSASERAATDA